MAEKKKTGVLLVNLGTPDAPTPAAVRRYLAEFLSDIRVVEIPRLIWLPILYLLILPLRPKRVAGNYAKIWRNDGSPLLAISKLLAGGVQEALGNDFQVVLGMRYGNPSMVDAINELMDSGCTDLTVLPLYPQNSATTTAAVWDALNPAMTSRRNVPSIRFISDYHDHPAYIHALAESVRQHWEVNGRSEKLLMSFHGIPQRNVDLGDPYSRQCEETANLLARSLGLKQDEWLLTYQSRFGKAEWLKPYTSQTLEELATSGVRKLDVICPGFAADCLETLEEIQVENEEIYKEAGGDELNYIPALNDRPEHIAALVSVLSENPQN